MAIKKPKNPTNFLGSTHVESLKIDDAVPQEVVSRSDVETEEKSAQVRKSVDSPPGMLTEDHHHTVHEERQVCYSSHLRPKSLHL